MTKFKTGFFILLLLTISLFGFSAATSPGNNSDMLNLWDTGPITLDPSISSEMTSHLYIMHIFSGLVCLNDELKPIPDIAESWQKSSDGKIYTFFLRKGVYFHNGKEVTAQDFKYSWERTCNPKTDSKTAEMYLNDIVGSADVFSGKTTELKGVEVIDKYTLKVTIDAPKAYFLSKMTYPTAMVVDKTNVESGKEWWRTPNGTGPYKLKEWKSGQSLELNANTRYYRAAPRINSIRFKLLAGMPIDLYELGEVDVAPVYESYIDRARDKNGPFYKELSIFPELSTFYIGFNTQKPPFNDVNIRLAFSYALNKDRIIHLTLKDTATKSNNIIPIDMPGFDKTITSPNYNIEKAKSYISNSKYGSVSKLPAIVVTTSGVGGNIGENLGAIIHEWQQSLGITITVRQLEPKIFMYNLDDEVDDIFMQGWIADYPDPQNFLDNLFRTGSPYNSGKYSSSILDTLLSKAAIEQNEPARLKLYSEAEQLILNEVPCLPMWSNVNYTLIKPYVQNYKLNPLGIPALSQVYIDRNK
jgi:oligopeptide transport system substrate-binding protein